MSKYLVSLPRPGALVALTVLMSTVPTARASDNPYQGPALRVDYSGPVEVANSQVRYTGEDRLTFFTANYLKDNLPELLPLRPAIDGWASRHGVHPRVLSHVVADYFAGRVPRGERLEFDEVARLAAAIDSVMEEEGDHPLAATRAIRATSEALGFSLRIPAELAQPRIGVSRLGGNPTLFGYFQPPWEIGETWAGGGAHGNTGSGLQNALDFIGGGAGWGDDTSQWWVASMQSGTVRVWSTCGMAIIHENGWVTDYYHLDNIQVSDMQPIDRDVRLSNYADNLDQATCTGGSSTGPHVHMSVTWNGDRVLVDESQIDFSAFSHHVGVGQYDSNCNTSWYTHFTVGQVCPFFRQLLNDAPTPTSVIFRDGFESGDTDGWNALVN
ncbi:MAG: hypothetical protein AAGM22_04090 [Acidobacteriota bacterium]